MDESSTTIGAVDGDSHRASRPSSRGPTRRARAKGGRPHEVRVTYSELEMALVLAAAQRDGVAAASWVGDAAVRAARTPEQRAAAHGWGEVMQELMVPRAELMAARQLLRNIGVNLNAVAATANSTGALAPQAATVVQLAGRAVDGVDVVVARVEGAVARLDAAVAEARQMLRNAQ